MNDAEREMLRHALRVAFADLLALGMPQGSSTYKLIAGVITAANHGTCDGNETLEQSRGNAILSMSLWLHKWTVLNSRDPEWGSQEIEECFLAEFAEDAKFLSQL